MLARSHRFHGQASLRRLQKSCQTIRGSQLTLKYAPNTRRRTFRVAVVVSRKVSKSAVVRNRIRRRIYENVRILSNDFHNPYDLVWAVYDERVATVPAERLRAEISKLCLKAGLLPAASVSHAIVKPKETN